MVLTLFGMEGIPERQMMLRPLEIAEIFGVSKQTVKNWIGRGVLRHKMIEGEYFVPREDVEAMMECGEGIVKTEERLKREEKKCEEAWNEMRLKREAIGDMVKFYGIVEEAVNSWMKIGEKHGGVDRQSGELVMCIMRGMTVNEIAERTGLTLQQIRRGIAVALGRMRKLGHTEITEITERRLGAAKGHTDFTDDTDGRPMAAEGHTEITEITERRLGAAKGHTDDTDDTDGRPMAAEGGARGEEGERDERRKMGILVTELGLPVRVQNALVEARINTVGDLVKYRKKELLNIKRCSMKTMDLLAEVVEKKLELRFKN